ncbi:MAG: hypothetical protein JJ895_13050 [Balneolaceae bacterium]|nr:hypothetical protein [Balneolaceae bacterium]
MINKNKAAQSRQLVFSILLSFILLSCEESGTVGAGFINESEIVADTIMVSELPIKSVDPYLGKLIYSATGAFNDPILGEINAMALFKPSIIQGDIGDLPMDTKALLRLNIDIENIYGRQDREARFKVLRVADFWRGSAFKRSDEVSVVESDGGPIEQQVGEFTLADFDTTGFAELELSGNWKSDFIRFYNNDDANRDSVYRHEDFGLAIVPEDDANEIIYARISTSRLLLIDPADEDTTTNIMLDWATDIEITGGTAPANNVVLSNLYDQYLQFNFTDIAQNLDNNNFVRAELVLTANENALQNSLTENEERFETPPFRIQLGPSNDIAYDLGFNTISSTASYDEGKYRFDITELFNASIFADTDITEVYLYAGQNSGYLSFSSFFDVTADAANAPKIIIFNLESEE